ncbi:MAG: SMC family ATPase [Candidatus Altiarchaeota archaeon]
MRLNRITLENWSCHEKLEADLTEGLQILGRNGTGKTSILEAIKFLFKKTASGYSNRVRNGARSAYVRLAFTHDSREYVVEKKILLEKPSTALMTCDGVQVADNPTSVYNSLNNILSEDMLERLLYVPQSGLTGILDRLSGREGKVEMDRLFGLDRLERVWTGVGEDLKEQDARVSVLSDQIKKHPEDAEESYRRDIEEFRKGEGELREKLLKNEEYRKNAESNLKKSEESLKGINEAKRRIDSLNTEFNRTSIGLAEAEKEIESAQARLEELRSKGEELAKLESEKKKLDKYPRFRVTLSSIMEINSRLDELSTVEEEKRITELEETLKKKPEAEREYAELEGKYQSLQKSHTEAAVGVKQKVDFIDELDTLGGKAKCPRCGQKLDSFHLTKEKQDTAVMLERMYENLKKIEAEMANIKAVYDDMKASMEEYRKDEAEYGQLRNQLEKAVRERKRLCDERDSNMMTLESMGYSGETIEFVEQKVADSNRMDGAIRELRKEIILKDRISEGKDESVKRKIMHESRRDELRKELGEISYDTGEHERLQNERDILSSEKHRLDSECNTLSADIKRISEQTMEREKKLVDYMELVKEHSDAERMSRKLAQAREIFHRDKGLVKYARESFIGGLNSILTNYFNRFNQNPRYLNVSFTREYDIEFKTSNGTLSLDQISGGEKIQLALALRIALIELMSPVRMLILDEPFGSLDEPHREILGEALTKISETGQLIIVTHVEVESLQLHNKIELEGY